MKKIMRSENRRQSFRFVWFPVTFITLIVLILTGCSDGGSGSDAGVTSADSLSSAVEGTFIDSPVQGLNYMTPTGAGLTDGNGRFFCLQGEMIQFMIGDVMLGQTMAKDVVTPMDFIEESEWVMGFNHPTLVNMGRFLQSLDADGNPENGIMITADVREEVRGRMIDFHQSMMDFENDPDVMAMFATLNGLNIPHNGMMWELVDIEGAQEHMVDHMGEYMASYMDEHMGTGSTDNDGDGNPMNGAMSENMNNQMGGYMDDEYMGQGSTDDDGIDHPMDEYMDDQMGGGYMDEYMGYGTMDNDGDESLMEGAMGGSMNSRNMGKNMGM